MIKMMRIDDRLIHGQVAYGWSNALGIEVILIISNDVANNEMRKTAYSVGKPGGVKLYFRNVEESIEAIEKLANSKYACLLLVERIEDALYTVKNSSHIKTVNLGGMRMENKRKYISDLVAVSPEEIEILKQIEEKGIDLEVRKLPSETKKRLKDLI